MIKKLLSLLLIFALFLSVCGCKSSNNTSSAQATEKVYARKSTGLINLLYSKTDSFNPYTAATQNNRDLCKLIFEPLIKADNNFNPVLRLAEKAELTESSCTVTLKNAVFSDGSPVTADDVLYSYNTAKSYGGLYTSHLYEVTSVSVLSSSVLVFNLSRRDAYFKNLLDFPIMKKGSDTVKDSDGVLIPPVGCGRYTVSVDEAKLKENPYFFGIKGSIKEINLINAPDSDSLSHYIEVGATELYYTDATNGKVIRMSGKRTDVNLNTMLYIGINLNSAGLLDKHLRYAISSAIDRSVICSEAYFNNAAPASGYFNPCLDEVKAVQSINSKADNEITVENLSKIGYNTKDSEGYFVNSSGNRIVLRLVVNTENRQRVVAANKISSMLNASGIAVKVIETSYADYLNCIKSNAFDLYLGEVSILPNFDMSPLVMPGGSMAFGTSVFETVADTDTPIDSTAETPEKIEEPSSDSQDTVKLSETEEQKNITAVINGYYGGVSSLSDVAGTLLTEMVQIPVLYRKGLYFYKDNIISGVESAESDIYYSIENYKLK